MAIDKIGQRRRREVKAVTAQRTGYVIGVDVGTMSVRAGVFALDGTMVAHAVEFIQIARPKENFVEQSSDDIWEATGRAVRAAVANAGIRPKQVIGISYDATCSLVALGKDLRPISVSPTGDPRWNIIVWMDHRAIEFADRINATRHPVLQYVGGVISPEMEPPKLLWLKHHLPETWRQAGKFLTSPTSWSFGLRGTMSAAFAPSSASGCILGTRGDGTGVSTSKSGWAICWMVSG